MRPEERLVFIQKRLEAALSPKSIIIQDDSERHKNHSGHGGGGHYCVTIVSEAFSGKSLLERHRMVYQAVNEAIGKEIHALNIKAYTPREYP
ncbi:BolA family protein [Candidatus Nitrosoglobus terrae]|uniref:BolA family protein n=1 Tax=Candidatus Nitrosoglobus terrae TaxID=1630141 RepID=A0A1Q2SLJ4_9GAMM|nr:BolA family protein [Candidatus Nitrosoglobus terrae]BAW79992.1 BolA family protein [Candidatus Nitrosoglobus terrae]